MAEIVLTRIDDRLIHGQVATQWVAKTGANTVFVLNEEVAKDPFKQELMNMIAPANAKTRYYTLKDGIKAIQEAAPEEKIMILVKDPKDVLTLIDGGIEIQDVNVGNLPKAEGKKEVSPSVYVDQKEVDAFKALHDQGVHLNVQSVPNTVPANADELLSA